jgi:SsrA-binding protein
MRQNAAGPGEKLIAQNRRARHDYEILESFEAGLVLTGTEIKSIRAGRANLRDSYARIEGGQAWVHNLHISPYEQGNRFNVEEKRTRRLLLRKEEINHLIGKTVEKGLTLIPLRLYLRRGYAKLELGLARGRATYDKRRAIAERDLRREMQREEATRKRGQRG